LEKVETLLAVVDIIKFLAF